MFFLFVCYTGSCNLKYNTDGNIGAVKSSVVIHGLLLSIDNKFDAQRVEAEGVKELVNNANKLATKTVYVSEELKVCSYVSTYSYDGSFRSF